MHDLGGLQNPQCCHWSDELQKKDVFIGKLCSRGFGAPGCHPSTSIDFANNALVSKSSVEPECMISEGYRTHGGVTGPMKFKKRTFFFSENCAPGVLGTWLPCMQSN